MKPFLIAC